MRSVKDGAIRINNIILLNKSGWEGLPNEAPFDRILVSAAADAVPQNLLDQLSLVGKIVIPVIWGIPEDGAKLVTVFYDGQKRGHCQDLQQLRDVFSN